MSLLAWKVPDPRSRWNMVSAWHEVWRTHRPVKASSSPSSCWAGISSSSERPPPPPAVPFISPTSFRENTDFLQKKTHTHTTMWEAAHACKLLLTQTEAQLQASLSSLCFIFTQRWIYAFNKVITLTILLLFSEQSGLWHIYCSMSCITDNYLTLCEVRNALWPFFGRGDFLWRFDADFRIPFSRWKHNHFI